MRDTGNLYDIFSVCRQHPKMIRTDSSAHVFCSQRTVHFFFSFKEDREHLAYYHPLHIHCSAILTKTPLTLNPPRYPNCKRRTEHQHHNFQPRQRITGQFQTEQAPGGHRSLGQHVFCLGKTHSRNKPRPRQHLQQWKPRTPTVL